jgi:ParB family chromosome partitioning protein
MFLTRKTAPKGTAPFIATALAADSTLLSNVAANHLAADLLGLEPGPAYGTHAGVRTAASASGDARGLVIALAQALAAYEAQMDRSCWREPRTHIDRYLTFLAEHGYDLSPVEARARITQAPEPSEPMEVPSPI